MEIKYEKLKLFFEEIKNTGFWRLVFGGWYRIKSSSYDAYNEFIELIGAVNNTTKELGELRSSMAVSKNDNDHLKLEKEKLNSSLKSTEEKIEQLRNETSFLKNENISLKQTEVNRKKEYDEKVATLDGAIKRTDLEREKEKDELHRKEIERLNSMKETWAKHQDSVKDFIKNICLRCGIEYVDDVPFKGSPDNTIKICDEYVIFDAKSPASEDLSNFPLYIKAQAESVKKYIKEENVRKDIFLVIPSNTVDVIKKFYDNRGDYQVYIVTLDVLEPLILSLKKIESYEFVSQLTPEERENICRIIGKFANMTKRRVQIDQYFAREFLNVLTKCEADLPEDILLKAADFETADPLNPPQARRAKQIPTSDLVTDMQKIQKEAEAKGIAFPSSLEKNIRNIPLNEGQESTLKD